MKKNETQLEKLLRLLSDHEWHWTDELIAEVGHRFSVSVQSAKEKGHKIKREQEGRQHRYRLL